jgi:hypothetical protein
MISETQLAEVIRLAMDRSNAKVRTAFPAKVTAFNPDNGPTASVQPAVQGAFWDVDLEEPVFFEFPEITNCPVHYPAGGGFQITYPLEPGDDCLVLVAERSIDEWMGTGNASNTPRMLRRFDLSDAIVIPGLAPSARPLTGVDHDALNIGQDETGLRLSIGNGAFEISTPAVAFVDSVTSLIAELESYFSVAIGAWGAVVPAQAAAATAATDALAALLAIRVALNSIKKT